MSTNTERELHIVVGFDGTEQAQLALHSALAQAHDREGVVHVIEVLDGKATFEEAVEQQRSVENSVNAAVQGQGVENYRVLIHTRIGTPAKEIIALADETDADLVVVGTHGRKGVSRLVMGSVAEQVLRNAHCPVLIVRPTEHRARAEGTDPSLQPEPPCSACVAQRFETRGAEWWCSAHARAPHPRNVFGGTKQPRMGDWSRYNR